MNTKVYDQTISGNGSEGHQSSQFIFIGVMERPASIFFTHDDLFAGQTI